MAAAVDTELLHRIAEAWAAGLLDATVKGTVLLGAAWGAARLLRSRPAAVRHLVWAVALVGLLLLPVLSGVLPRIEVPGLPRMTAGPGVEAPAPSPSPGVATPGRGAAARPPDASAPAGPPPPSGDGRAGRTALLSRIPVAAVLGGAWLLGVLVVLARGLVGRARIWWLARSAQRVDEGPGAEAKRRLARELELRRDVELLRGPASTVPMTWGVLRPRILLPREARHWTAGCRRNVLLHEMAHVRRADCLMRLAGRAAAALYWFHPLVWVALRRMRREQEEACDDYVLRDGVRPSEYAGQLVRLARGLRAVGSGVHAGTSGEGPSEFLRRMRSLLRADRPRDRVPGGEFAALGTTAASLVVVLASLGPAAPEEEAAVDAHAGSPPPLSTGEASLPAGGPVEGPSDAVLRPAAGADAPEHDGGEDGGPPAGTATMAATPGDGPPRSGDAAGAAGDGGEQDRGAAGGEPKAAGASPPDPRDAPTRTPGESPGVRARSRSPSAARVTPALVPDDHAGLRVGAGGGLGGRGWSAFAGRAPGAGSAVVSLAADAGAGRSPEGTGAGEGETRRATDSGREARSPGRGDRSADDVVCSGRCTADAALRRLQAQRDSTARRELLLGLARSGSPRSAAVLMELSYRAPRAADRRLVVEALAEVPGASADRYLFQVARANPWVSVRAAAIDELGRSESDRVVPWLVNLAYNDVNAEVQKFVVSVLARMQGSAARSGLVQIARSHPQDGVRNEAIRWLLRTGGEGVSDFLGSA